MNRTEDKMGSFLAPETRCGYYVDSKMKAVWNVQLDIVEEFMRICERHLLKYLVIRWCLYRRMRVSKCLEALYSEVKNG